MMVESGCFNPVAVLQCKLWGQSFGLEPLRTVQPDTSGLILCRQHLNLPSISFVRQNVGKLPGTSGVSQEQ